MNRKVSAALVAPVVAASLLSIPTASAQTNAYATKFTTSVTYQNVGALPATITFNFYAENNGTAIPIQRTLAPGAGSSIFIGGETTIAAGFNGSAVVQSDQPIVATMVQLPEAASSVKNRPLSNGFGANDGAKKVLIASVLKNQFNTNTKFSVQNVGTVANTATVKFFEAGSTTAKFTLSLPSIPVGAAKYVDAGAIADLGASFNGSATIEGTDNLVASALELSTTGTSASSFEGVANGTGTVYMASAICKRFNQNTSYAVQNTADTGTASVKVTYSNGQTETKSISAGSKASFQGCGDAGTFPANFSGSATIVSTGGNIVAIGKVNGGGVSTAFVGAGAGAAKLALPYVRWSETQYVSGVRQRAFIAVQNVGTATIAAGQATVKYYDKDGKLVGTHALGELASGAKLNSSAFDTNTTGDRTALAEFGYSGTTFGGSAIIEGPAGSQLVAVVRVTSQVPSNSTSVGEDFNGIAVQ